MNAVDLGVLTWRSTSLSSALRRYAFEQLVAVGAHLEMRGRHVHVGVHGARKAIRRFRAVLALVRFSPEAASTRLDRAVRRLSKQLSILRDAHVVINVVAEQIKQPGSVDNRRLWRSLRKSLRERSEQQVRKAFAADADFARLRQRVLRWQKQFAALRWPDLTAQNVLTSLRENARRARKAQRDAEREATLAARHRWRRRVRRLRMQLQCVRELTRKRPATKAVRLQARWVVDEAFKILPSVDALAALSDALGATLDIHLLRNVVRYHQDASQRAQLLRNLRFSETRRTIAAHDDLKKHHAPTK